MVEGSLLNSACWPNLHYFWHIVNSRRILIEQHETFARQSYRNRYEILSANGILALTVPLKRDKNHGKTKDAQISYNENWQLKHWRAISSAYGNSPYFRFFEDELKHFYQSQTALLIDYNMAQLRFLFKILKLEKKELSFTDTYAPRNGLDSDHRDIVNMKRDEWTDVPGSQLSDKPYYQTFGTRHGFVPNLSILDLLFNLGLKTRDYLSDAADS